MDSALKQRLLGATVLVVLAVIFLPMLLDGGGGGGEQTVPLDLPAQPAEGMRTEVVPLPPPGSRGAAAAVAPPPEEPIATVDADAPARVDAVSGEVVGGGSSGPAATTAPARPVPAPSPAPAPRPQASPHASPSAQAGAATGGTARDGGRYFVSFGTYGQTANAAGLVAQLERAGIAARAESVTVNGAPAMRVRAGPFDDRPAAEAVRQRARAARADLEPTIVEAEVAAPAAGAATASPARRGFAVQIGAFADQATANARRDRLRQAGFTAFVDSVRTEQGLLWRVRVGPEIERADAERLRAALKSRLALDGQVVAHP